MSGGVGVFAFESVRNLDRAAALRQVLPMQGAGNFELGLPGGVKADREHGHAVFVAFTLANGELILSEINVLDAQAHTFHHPKGTRQAGAIEQACHEKFGT